MRWSTYVDSTLPWFSSLSLSLKRSFLRARKHASVRQTVRNTCRIIAVEWLCAAKSHPSQCMTTDQQCGQMTSVFVRASFRRTLSRTGFTFLAPGFPIHVRFPPGDCAPAGWEMRRHTGRVFFWGNIQPPTRCTRASVSFFSFPSLNTTLVVFNLPHKFALPNTEFPAAVHSTGTFETTPRLTALSGRKETDKGGDQIEIPKHHISFRTPLADDVHPKHQRRNITSQRRLYRATLRQHCSASRSRFGIGEQNILICFSSTSLFLFFFFFGWLSFPWRGQPVRTCEEQLASGRPSSADNAKRAPNRAGKDSRKSGVFWLFLQSPNIHPPYLLVSSQRTAKQSLEGRRRSRHSV